MLEGILTEKEVKELFYSRTDIVAFFGEETWLHIKEDANFCEGIISNIKYANGKGALATLEEAVLKEQVPYARRIPLGKVAEAFGIAYENLEEVAEWEEMLCPVRLKASWHVSLNGMIEYFKKELRRAEQDLSENVSEEELLTKSFVISDYITPASAKPKSYDRKAIIMFYNAVLLDLHKTAAEPDGKVHNPNFVNTAPAEFKLEDELRKEEKEEHDMIGGSADEEMFIRRLISRFPVLTKDGEQALGKEIQDSRMNIFKKLLKHHKVLSKIYCDIYSVMSKNHDKKQGGKDGSNHENHGEHGVYDVLWLKKTEREDFKKAFLSLDKGNKKELAKFFYQMIEKNMIHSGYDDELIVFSKKEIPRLYNNDKELSENIARRENARNALIAHNYKLANSIAMKYQRRCTFLTVGDLFTYGSAGLATAVNKYDYSKGFKFSTYATWWVRQAITRAMADNERDIRLPVHMVESLHRFYRIGTDLFMELGREPTDEEIKQRMGRDISLSKIQLFKKISAGTVSLSSAVGDDQGSELGDFIEDAKAYDPEKEATTKVFFDYVMDKIKSSGKFDARDIDILKLRLGEETLEKVGLRYHVTRERIRQIEFKVIKKARGLFRSLGHSVSNEPITSLRHLSYK
jgi:RNA polymerase sigma factor (sigma-70 family)